jgi:hypothetical protein
MNFSDDNKLVQISHKIEAGERLSLSDGLDLYATH